MRRPHLLVAVATVLSLCAALLAWQCSKTPEDISTSSKSPSRSTESLGRVGDFVGYPDLTVDTDRLARSIQIVNRNIKSTDCSVVEGCATSGRRKLLRFDVATPNFGTADLIVGSPLDHPELFEYSPCHGHYHYKNFSIYRLVDASGVVVASHKQAFCLMDILRYTTGAVSNGYTCSNQGISVGWADLYDKSLDCQWIDITGVARGNYFIEVVINRAHVFDEGPDSYPDSVRVPVSIR